MPGLRSDLKKTSYHSDSNSKHKHLSETACNNLWLFMQSHVVQDLVCWHICGFNDDRQGTLRFAVGACSGPHPP